MRSILQSAVLLTAFSLSRTSAQSDTFDATTNTGGQDPKNIAGGLALRTPTDLGCFSSPGKLFDMGVYTYQTPGWCQPLCVRLARNYFGLVNGTNCFCGDSPPSNEFKVESLNCDQKCSGFDKARCGGTNYWNMQVANYRIGDPTGTVSITIPAPTYTYMDPAGASESSSATAPATVVVTQQATAAPTASSDSSSSSSGPNTAAVAGGVVVSIVVVIAIVVGIFFFMRRKKQQALAEEQRRHEMMTNFVTAEKPGSGYTPPDSRLDPSLMFQRRLSEGSIKDNEDYSRRILRVANPDR